MDMQTYHITHHTRIVRVTLLAVSAKMCVCVCVYIYYFITSIPVYYSLLSGITFKILPLSIMHLTQ